MMTKEDKYLDLAEELLRQCVQSERQSLAKWIFWMSRIGGCILFSCKALGKYLDVTAEVGGNTRLWDYARKSLIHYAKLDGDKRRALSDNPEKLEFPQ